MFPESGQYCLDHYHKCLCSMVKFQEFLQWFLEILSCFACHYYYSFLQFIQMQEGTRRNILVMGWALYKKMHKYLLNALNVLFSLKIFLILSVALTHVCTSLRKFVFLLLQLISSSHLFMRSSKLSCRRLLKYDTVQHIDLQDDLSFEDSFDDLMALCYLSVFLALCLRGN